MANQTYGVDEAVGDGTKIQQQKIIKRYEYGALPNTATKNLAHGIDVTKVLRFWAFATNGTLYSNVTQLSTPAATLTIFHLTATNIVMTSTADLSAYTVCTVYVELLP